MVARAVASFPQFKGAHPTHLFSAPAPMLGIVERRNGRAQKSSGEGRGSSAAGALDGGLVRPFPGECINFGDEPFGLVGAGIEVVTDPLC